MTVGCVFETGGESMRNKVQKKSIKNLRKICKNRAKDAGMRG